MKKLSIVGPCYNEQETIYPFLEATQKVEQQMKDQLIFDYIFVNDGSKDDTLTILRDVAKRFDNVHYLSFSRNFGKEAGLLAGLEAADGDLVTVMDADLQDPPELIPDMIKYWEEGYDDVYAKRRSRKGETWLKKFTSHAFYRVLKSVSKVPIQEDTGDFRLLDRRCVQALKQLRETQRYTKGMFSWIGYNKKEILFDRDSRAAGETKWNYFKLMDLAIEGITSFTTFPLKMATYLGVVISFGALIYMAFIIIKTLIYGGDVAGYPSLMAVILFLGGIQLLFLGVIGEYLGRIFNETKNRPLYFVDEYNDKKVDNESDNMIYQK